MSNNQKATDLFEIIGQWKALFDRKPIDTEALLSLMEGETKMSLMNQLSNILWAKSRREIAELILAELSAKEIRELAADFGMKNG